MIDDFDVTQNIKLIEKLKCELLMSVSELFCEMNEKHEFIDLVFRKFMDMYVVATGNTRNGVKLTVTINNNNHYLCFEEFGICCRICIYTNGNVAIKLKEYGKKEYSEQIFEYTSDFKSRTEFLNKLDGFLGFSIILCATNYNSIFHSFFELIETNDFSFMELYDSIGVVADEIVNEIKEEDL